MPNYKSEVLTIFPEAFCVENDCRGNWEVWSGKDWKLCLGISGKSEENAWRQAADSLQC